MKTIFTTAFFALLFSATFATSPLNGGGSEAEVANAKQEMYTQMKSLIDYHNFASFTQAQGKVYVRFQVNDDQTVTVKAAGGANQNLVEHVKTSLNGKKVEIPSALTGQEFTTKFDFSIVQ